MPAFLFSVQSFRVSDHTLVVFFLTRYSNLRLLPYDGTGGLLFNVCFHRLPRLFGVTHDVPLSFSRRNRKYKKRDFFLFLNVDPAQICVEGESQLLCHKNPDDLPILLKRKFECLHIIRKLVLKLIVILFMLTLTPSLRRRRWNQTIKIQQWIDFLTFGCDRGSRRRWRTAARSLICLQPAAACVHWTLWVNTLLKKENVNKMQ